MPYNYFSTAWDGNRKIFVSVMFGHQGDERPSIRKTLHERILMS